MTEKLIDDPLFLPHLPTLQRIAEIRASTPDRISAPPLIALTLCAVLNQGDRAFTANDIHTEVTGPFGGSTSDFASVLRGICTQGYTAPTDPAGRTVKVGPKPKYYRAQASVVRIVGDYNDMLSDTIEQSADIKVRRLLGMAATGLGVDVGGSIETISQAAGVHPQTLRFRALHAYAALTGVQIDRAIGTAVRQFEAKQRANS